MNRTPKSLFEVKNETVGSRADSLQRREPRLQRASQINPRTDPLPGKKCPWCGSRNLIEGEAKPPHWLQYVCGDCNRHAGYIGTPDSVKQARRHRLKFGHYQGLTLGELATSPKGLDYLRWLKAVRRGEPGRLAGLVLSGVQQ
jgi:hypothetical protein